jgi:hypothetical protein
MSDSLEDTESLLLLIGVGVIGYFLWQNLGGGSSSGTGCSVGWTGIDCNFPSSSGSTTSGGAASYSGNGGGSAGGSGASGSSSGGGLVDSSSWY